MCDNRGKITDETRALFLLCEAKGIMQSYFRAARSFSRRLVKPTHSIPAYRLMYFGWQPTVNHFDFAGILNANAIWSFTVGLPALLFSFVFILVGSSRTEPAPCEVDATTICGITDDFQRPTVQFSVGFFAIILNLVSIGISVSNICIDFPAQIFDMVEKEEEELYHNLLAASATKEWEEKIAEQLKNNVNTMLKVSTTFDANPTPGMEAPRLVIDDVIKLEKKAMKKRVAIFEFFLVKQEKAKAAAAKERKRRKREEAAAQKAAKEAAAAAAAAAAAPKPADESV